MEKLHFDEIDICKGIAMLLVLWHHSFILFPINMLDISWCHHAMAINGSFFMEVFFVVSGYLFAFSRPRSFGENLANKVKRLLIPYISFGAVTLGIKLLVPSLVNRNVVSINEYLCKFVTGG